MLKVWHVTYYYLATGMEGRADFKDYGIVYADSKASAIAIIARTHGSDWGLSAEEVSPSSSNYFS